MHTPTGLLVNGIFGGAISSFELSTDRINGRVGTCGWDVRWNGKFYSGSRGCGSRIEPISVSLPATMARWSDVEVAGALGLLLNVGAPIGMDRLADNSAEFRGPPNPTLAPYYRLAYSNQVSMVGGSSAQAGMLPRATGLGVPTSMAPTARPKVARPKN